MEMRPVLYWLAVGVSLFHLWANTLGQLPELHVNSLHLGLLGALGFLGLAGNPKVGPPKFLGLAAAGVMLFLGGIYLLFAEEPLHERGEIMTRLDTGIAALTFVLALILCWRTSGVVVPILVLLAVSYVILWGRFVDGIFHFRGLSLSRVLYRAYFTGEGLFGMIATISSSYVFMFVLFSAFLLKSGGGEFIIRLARTLMGRLTGGPGYIAVMASGLMGTISGSAVATTVSTGSITIPLMQRSGFESKFAAAVCVAASTGGQLMPPIMGAGAFIMAQWTGQPYSVIIGIAILPALLYFASLMFHVYFETARLGLNPAPVAARERITVVLRDGFHFFIPIAVLIGLLAAGYSPTYAAGLAIAAVVAASWLNPKHRMQPRDVADALALGARHMVQTGVLLVCTGLIIGSLNMTGVSVAFSQMVIEWSGGQLLPALALIALASLVLGMGLPVTAAYVMLAVVAVPSLQDMGVSLLAAHMILFWLSQDSNVTPPVCLAAFTGAAIAGSPPMATGFASWKIAKALYILPLLFAYSPLIDGSLSQKLIAAAFAMAGLFAFAAGFSGWLLHRLNRWQSVTMIAIALSLFWPGLAWNILGLATLTAATLWSAVTRHRFAGASARRRVES